jgi:hypothetical protein
VIAQLSPDHALLASSATQQYQQLQRAGQLEESDGDAAFIARPQRPLDPWKVHADVARVLSLLPTHFTHTLFAQAKYFEEYWGQRLGLPPPPPVRSSQASIETELPPLTPASLAQLAFTYSAQQQPQQSPQPDSAAAAQGNCRLAAGTPFDAEAVPPRKRKLEPSSLEVTPDQSLLHCTLST